MGDQNNIERDLDDLFSGKISMPVDAMSSKTDISFSYLFFSDVREEISDQDKYGFARELVEFADQAYFEAVYFPERHFSEFGSIYANNGIMAAYFAPLTKNVRLRTAAVTNTLHHPVQIVENWAMIDVLSNGRVDLGFGNGWNKADFILSPDTYDIRSELRNERIPIIQKLWRGEAMNFPGPGGEMFETRVFPRPIQRELNVWYVTLSEEGFAYAGSQGYNIFTMLYGIDLPALGKKIARYHEAREAAGLDPKGGKVSLMMHTLVHPDLDWVQHQISSPFKKYIRSTLAPHMKSAGKTLSPDERDKMVDYSFVRYFKTGGIFGSIEDCQRQIDLAQQVGVTEIAFLQDFGVDYGTVKSCLQHLEQLVDQNRNKT